MCNNIKSRLLRKEVDEILKELISTIENFNTTDKAYRITSLILFGSSLYERASYGDVDIDFEIDFKVSKTMKWSQIEIAAKETESYLMGACKGVNAHWGAVAHLDCAHRCLWRCEPMSGRLLPADKSVTPNGEYWMPYLKRMRA